MRKHAVSDPQRKEKLKALLNSGLVTQPAINHAGHVDGGERGGGCPRCTHPSATCTAPLGVTTSPPAPPLTLPLAPPQHGVPQTAGNAAFGAMQQVEIAEAMAANPTECASQGC